MKRRLAAIAFALALTGAALPASAASAVVTVTATTLVFTVANMTSGALASAPVSATASVVYTTTAGGAGGTVTLNSITLTSASGATLDQRDFTLTCKLTSGNAGFVASPAQVLSGTGATPCATLTQGKNNVTSNFSLTLTLNETAAATVPFQAAPYITATFSVTATAT
jgi:hypothetical protein